MERQRNKTQTLEAVRGGGGSIKVGTTGTIGSLMRKELKSARSSNHTPIPSGNKSQSVTSGPSAPRRSHLRKSLDDANSSKGDDTKHHSLEDTRKARSFTGKPHHIPMLASDNIGLDRTSYRERNGNNRRANIVEVVDIRCGGNERAWTSPITNRLRKLGFSKLSESII